MYTKRLQVPIEGTCHRRWNWNYNEQNLKCVWKCHLHNFYILFRFRYFMSANDNISWRMEGYLLKGPCYHSKNLSIYFTVILRALWQLWSWSNSEKKKWQNQTNESIKTMINIQKQNIWNRRKYVVESTVQVSRFYEEIVHWMHLSSQGKHSMMTWKHFRITGHWEGKLSVTRWFPSQKGQ